MKLYAMQCGVIYPDKSVLIAGAASQEFNIPVPYFLIEHEKGYVLFDSGHNQSTVNDIKTLPQPILDAVCPGELEGGFVLDALKRAGVKPEDIMYHICSHLHFDHAGGIGLFPNATYVVQRQELHYAYVPDPFMKILYLREDFDKDVNWLFLDGYNDNRYDLFGDGKIIIYYTPGHTPGHQSLLVNLEKNGPVFLTVDSCYTLENLDGLLLSSLNANAQAAINSLQTIKDLQKRGVKIITGHDPDAWLGVKKFPEFYE